MQGQSAADAIAELAKAFPKPTNAQALAVLVAGFEIPEIDPDKPGKDAWAVPWSAPFGVLPRMRLLACGWTKRGDTLKSADDAAWWSSEFLLDKPVSLPRVKGFVQPSVWTALATYAAWVETNVKDVSWTLTPDLFSGDSNALSTELVNVAEDLARLSAPLKGTSNRADGCTPYIVAIKPGQQPIPNSPCIASLSDKAGPLRPVVDVNDSAKRFGLFVLVMYVLSKLPDR